MKIKIRLIIVIINFIIQFGNLIFLSENYPGLSFIISLISYIVIANGSLIAAAAIVAAGFVICIVIGLPTIAGIVDYVINNIIIVATAFIVTIVAGIATIVAGADNYSNSFKRDVKNKKKEV